jgi:hypothetical protein
MIALATVIERFAPQYLERYGNSVLPSQRQALRAMVSCRSRLSSQMLAQCGQCNAQRLVPHSCGHRNCPHCQHFEGQRWIERQTQALVPAAYFLITFTVPSELRTLLWQLQRALYAALMDCAWGTLQTFGQNHRQLRGLAGAVAVLHTHSRQLAFHPHVHLAMPAAAIDPDGSVWRTLRSAGKRYLFNHKALAQVFRARFLAAVRALGLEPPDTLPEKWVVDCKAVGGQAGGRKVMVYLGRYLYRGVIQERDILRCENGQVTYRWRDSKTRAMHIRTVGGVEFLRLVLQHVLPKGFRRTRNYGFLHPNCKRAIVLLRLLALRRRARPSDVPPPTTDAQRPKLLCRCCGAPMHIVRRRIAPLVAASPPRVPEGLATR